MISLALVEVVPPKAADADKSRTTEDNIFMLFGIESLYVIENSKKKIF